MASFLANVRQVSMVNDVKLKQMNAYLPLVTTEPLALLVRPIAT